MHLKGHAIQVDVAVWQPIWPVQHFATDKEVLPFTAMNKPEHQQNLIGTKVKNISLNKLVLSCISILVKLIIFVSFYGSLLGIELEFYGY